MSVTVIVPVLNGARTLGEQLTALASQQYEGPWEVLVVDNGSTDGSGELATGWSGALPRLRVVDAPERQNLSYARNTGAKAADGDFLMFCDADDVVAERWIDEMVRVARSSDLVGGSIALDRLNSDRVRAWREPVTAGSLPVALKFLPYAVGANFGVRKAVFEELGGCDETFGICGDDIDLSWRTQLSGFRLAYAPEAVVHYRLRPRLRDLVRQQLAYGRAEVGLREKYADAGLPDAVEGERRRRFISLLSRPDRLVRSSALRGRWLRDMAYIVGVFGSERSKRPGTSST